MVPVPCRTREVLLPLIQRWIKPGSVISSDCWKPYSSISSLPECYTHKTVNHSKEYVAADGTCTNTIEGSWRHMKRSLPLSVRQSKYDGYLAEFLWRRSNKGKDLFLTFVKDIAECCTPITHD